MHGEASCILVLTPKKKEKYNLSFQFNSYPKKEANGDFSHLLPFLWKI